MKSILAKKSKGRVTRSLSAGQKAQAALETLRGARSVEEIAQHWQVDPSELLHWQYTLVDRAASLFDECEAGATEKLDQLQIVHDAMISKMFEDLDAREALQQSEARLHRLLAYQEELKEEERKRIALEIHDALGQNLLAVRIDLSMLEERTRIRHPRLHRRAAVVLDNIDGAIRSVRSMINELRPFELELGLATAVQWQVNRFQRMHEIASKLEFSGCNLNSAPLNDKVVLAVFRTLQEAMNNVVGHAMASFVKVSLNHHESGLELVVEDNGIGMQAPTADSVAGLGLASMTERLNSLGGTLTLDVPVSGGTRLRARLPLLAKDKATEVT